MGFWSCAVYLSITGVAGFLGGRIIPKDRLTPDKGLFRCRRWERDGKIYEKIWIKKWQNRLPDMSRILPFMMPPKNLEGDYASRLPDMIAETCVAEIVHLMISVLGLYCLRLWPGIGGIVVVVIHCLLLNLPFILIQRYNRPRLLRLGDKLQRTEVLTERNCVEV